MFRKGIALVVMLLFVGLSILPSSGKIVEKSSAVLLDEDFSGSFPPDGWSTDWWTQCNISCVIEPPCACLLAYQYENDSAYITSKAVDASNYEKVILEFWFAADVQTYCYLYFKYRENETSPWKDITPWENPVILDFLEGFKLEANFGPGGGGDALQIKWEYLGSNYNSFYLDDVKILGNLGNPPGTPEIEGQRRFNEGEGGEFPYTIYSIDPDDDDLWYCINWSDGTMEWFGPYESGEELIINVTIPLERGTYELFKVKARDIFGAESDWAIFEVTVPKNQQASNMWYLGWLERFPLLQKILDVLRLNIR